MASPSARFHHAPFAKLDVRRLGPFPREYVGLSESGNEAIYLKQLHGEIGVGGPSVFLYGDNESSLKLAENPVFYRRSKHILLKYHSLRDRVEEGITELCKVDTGLNAADMMIKNVEAGILRVCKQLAGMVIGD